MTGAVSGVLVGFSTLPFLFSYIESARIMTVLRGGIYLELSILLLRK
jgi:hypothetical protein